MVMAHEQAATVLAEPTHRYVEVAGLKLHYLDRGGDSDKRTFVLLHGGAAHAHWWDGVAPLLTPYGRVLALDLVTLVDDRHYFPKYEAVPLVRTETLRRHPELRKALDGLAGQIDADTMRRLNHEVDGLHRDAAKVARAFLTSKGLLSK